MAEGPFVIAIAAHKGGVGKTTTAIHLASGLVRRGLGPVLLVDLDPQGHSSLGLGVIQEDEEVDPASTVAGLLARVPAPLDAVCREVPGVAGLYVAPATIDLEEATVALTGRLSRERVLVDALEGGNELFRFMVLDCPPSLGAIVGAALHAATHVIVPCRMEARATTSLRGIIGAVREVRGRLFDNWRILRTVVDSHRKTANTATEGGLQRFYAGSLFDTVIPVSEALNKAQIMRLDGFAFDATSPGATAYWELVLEVSQWVERDSPAPM